MRASYPESKSGPVLELREMPERRGLRMRLPGSLVAGNPLEQPPCRGNSSSSSATKSSAMLIAVRAPLVRDSLRYPGVQDKPGQ